MPELERGAGPAGCLMRLVWMLLGNFVLAIILIAIAQGSLEDGWISRLDLAFWAVTAAMIAVRYADIRYFQGRTADNKPADLSHWKKYSLSLVGIAAAAWATAKFLL